MTWQLEFYSERRRTLARYQVEAQTPAAAQILGRQALLAEHRPPSARPAGSLFEQAQRVGGQNADGWILYRIARLATPMTAAMGPRSNTLTHRLGPD